jgi:hypothetical protein
MLSGPSTAIASEYTYVNVATAGSWQVTREHGRFSIVFTLNPTSARRLEDDLHERPSLIGELVDPAFHTQAAMLTDHVDAM